MKNKIIIIHILNVLITAVFVVYLTQAFKFIEFPFRFTGRFFIISIIALEVIKQAVISFLDLSDPIKKSKISKVFYLIGFSTLGISLLFKIMHWPYFSILGFLPIVSFILSLVFSLIPNINSNELNENEDIIDDNF